MKIKNIILGAGLSGLCSAYSLKRNFIIFEKENKAGGLTSTQKIKNFYFDHTGHWLHLNNDLTKNFVKKLGLNYFSVERKSKILLFNRYIDYPFQFNLNSLPKDLVYRALIDLYQRESGNLKENNFRNFCYKNFGKTISDLFLFPYNKKLWGEYANNITTEWCKNFFPKPNVEKIIEGAIKKNKFGGYNKKFIYPKTGGIQTLSDLIVKSVGHKKINLNSKVQSIDIKNKKIKINNKIYEYKNLISSIPLPELLKLSLNLPKDISSLKNKFKCTELMYLNYGVKNKVMKNIHWLYLPDKSLPFYRIGCSSNAAPTLAPKNKSSIYLEVSNWHKKKMTHNEIKLASRKFLKDMKIINSISEIEVEQLNRVKYGYVIFDKNYKKIKSKTLNFLQKNNIFPVGRYGLWKYSSMEDSMLDGLNIHKKLKNFR